MLLLTSYGAYSNDELASSLAEDDEFLILEEVKGSNPPRFRRLAASRVGPLSSLPSSLSELTALTHVTTSDKCMLPIESAARA